MRLYGPDGRDIEVSERPHPLLVRKKFEPRFVQITRSFSFKLNCGMRGGFQYESVDFFESQSAACAPEEAERVSEELYRFCKSQVMKAVREHLEAMRSGAWERQIEPHPAAKANAAEFERRQAARLAIEKVG